MLIYFLKLYVTYTQKNCFKTLNITLWVTKLLFFYFNTESMLNDLYRYSGTCSKKKDVQKY